MIGLVLICNTVFAQKVNKDFIDGEIYIKVKQKPQANSTKQVNFSTELPFLQKYISAFVLKETKKIGERRKQWLRERKNESCGSFRSLRTFRKQQQ